MEFSIELESHRLHNRTPARKLRLDIIPVLLRAQAGLWLEGTLDQELPVSFIRQRGAVGLRNLFNVIGASLNPSSQWEGSRWCLACKGVQAFTRMLLQL